MDPLRLKSSSSHGNLKQHHTPTQPHDAELLICSLTFYRSLKSKIKTESERFTSVLWRLSSGTSAGFGGVDQNEKWRHSKCPNSLRMLQIDYFLSLTVWGIQRGVQSFISTLHPKLQLMAVLAHGSVFSPVGPAASGVLQASQHNTS